MWRVTIADHSGAYIEKSPVAGPDQAIEAWEGWHDKHQGTAYIMKLLRRSTVELSHRFDGEEGTQGFLPKEAARDFFEARTPVGRPTGVPTTKVYFRIPDDILESVDEAATSRGLSRTQYLRMLITVAHEPRPE